MSLVQGWDLIPAGRHPVAGDLILLEVRKPRQVAAPPGWSSLGELPWTDDDGWEHIGHVFWKIIGPREIDPVFTTGEPSPEWEIRGSAVTGYAPASPA
jgi:hypothetical protein